MMTGRIISGVTFTRLDNHSSENITFNHLYSFDVKNDGSIDITCIEENPVLFRGNLVSLKMVSSEGVTVARYPDMLVYRVLVTGAVDEGTQITYKLMR